MTKEKYCECKESIPADDQESPEEYCVTCNKPIKPEDKPEKWEESFDYKINDSNYTDEPTGWLEEPNDSLLDPEYYPESSREIDPEKVKDFIRTLLTSQRQKDKEAIIDVVNQFTVRMRLPDGIVPVVYPEVITEYIDKIYDSEENESQNKLEN